MITFFLLAGVKDVTAEDPEKVFDTLEKLLWNHPSAVNEIIYFFHVLLPFLPCPNACFLLLAI